MRIYRNIDKIDVELEARIKCGEMHLKLRLALESRPAGVTQMRKGA